jgi:hypothetical protein
MWVNVTTTSSMQTINNPKLLGTYTITGMTEINEEGVIGMNYEHTYLLGIALQFGSSTYASMHEITC